MSIDLVFPGHMYSSLTLSFLILEMHFGIEGKGCQRGRSYTTASTASGRSHTRGRTWSDLFVLFKVHIHISLILDYKYLHVSLTCICYIPVTANCSLSVADGTTQGDPILGTESPSTDNHEDVDPFAMESDDVDPMQEDLLNEIYEKTADVSQYSALFNLTWLLSALRTHT